MNNYLSSLYLSEFYMIEQPDELNGLTAPLKKKRRRIQISIDEYIKTYYFIAQEA
jgi:hypothetical protein